MRKQRHWFKWVYLAIMAGSLIWDYRNIAKGYSESSAFYILIAALQHLLQVAAVIFLFLNPKREHLDIGTDIT